MGGSLDAVIMVEPSSNPDRPDFRTSFCKKYRCSTERYETAVLSRCFPLWVRPLGVLLLALKPHLFRRELALISRLGGVVGDANLRQELEGYAYENARDKRFRTESLGLRLSRRRFVHLVRTVFPPEP